MFYILIIIKIGFLKVIYHLPLYHPLRTTGLDHQYTTRDLVISYYVKCKFAQTYFIGFDEFIHLYLLSTNEE